MVTPRCSGAHSEFIQMLQIPGLGTLCIPGKQHDPGALVPVLTGAARRTACCPVLPNMGTEINMLFPDITSKFLYPGLLSILFQDSLAF